MLSTTSIAKASAYDKRDSEKKRLMAEFSEKSNILSKYIGAFPTPAGKYFADLYGGFDGVLPYVRADARKKKIRRAENIRTLITDNLMKKDAYYYPCLFFYSFAKEALIEKQCAFIIDLDNVTPVDLRILLANEIKDMKPTYIVNSGRGIHLVFIFDVPIDAYNWRKPILKEALTALKGFFRGENYNFDVDDTGTALCHSYRIVGTLSKLGQVATAYNVGAKWKAADLLKKLGIDPLRLDKKPQQPQRKRQEKAAADNVVSIENLRKLRRLYNYVKRRIIHDVTEGHRYSSLFALAIVGKKCNVMKSTVEQDIKNCIDLFNQKDNRHSMKSYEAQKAMKGYSDIARTVRSTTLEELIGLEFERKTKRNGRTQEDHLRIARASRNTKQAVDRESTMRKYLETNPSASLKELVEALGWGKATVVKYRKIVLGCK